MDARRTHVQGNTYYNRYGVEIRECDSCINYTIITQPKCDRCTETIKRIQNNPKLAKDTLLKMGWSCI